MTCTAAIRGGIPIYVDKWLPRDFWRLVERDIQPSVSFGWAVDVGLYVICGELVAIDFAWLLLLEAA